MWAAADDTAGRIDAVAVAHVQVHDDAVGLKLVSESDCFVPAACLPDDDETGQGAEEGAQSLVDDRMIVHDEDAYTFVLLRGCSPCCQRDVRDDAQACHGARVEHQGSTEFFCSFPHRAEPDAYRGAFVDTFAVVAHVDDELVGGHEKNPAATGSGMAEDVGQRLENDQIGSDLGTRRKADNVADHIDRNRDAVAMGRAAHAGSVFLDSAHQAELVEHAGRKPWATRRTSVIASRARLSAAVRTSTAAV